MACDTQPLALSASTMDLERRTHMPQASGRLGEALLPDHRARVASRLPAVGPAGWGGWHVSLDERRLEWFSIPMFDEIVDILHYSTNRGVLLARSVRNFVSPGPGS